MRHHDRSGRYCHHCYSLPQPLRGPSDPALTLTFLPRELPAGLPPSLYPPLPELLGPLHTFDAALSEFLREDILGAAQFFGSLQILLSSLPLSQGGLGITLASDLFHFAFLSSRFDSLDLQTGLLASAALPRTDAAVVTALASAPAAVRTAYT